MVELGEVTRSGRCPRCGTRLQNVRSFSRLMCPKCGFTARRKEEIPYP